MGNFTLDGTFTHAHSLKSNKKKFFEDSLKSKRSFKKILKGEDIIFCGIPCLILKK